MYRKFRTTIIREQEDFSLDTLDSLSKDSSERFNESSSDESGFQNYMDEAKTYFPPKKSHIAPLFQLTLASSKILIRRSY